MRKTMPNIERWLGHRGAHPDIWRKDCLTARCCSNGKWQPVLVDHLMHFLAFHWQSQANTNTNANENCKVKISGQRWLKTS